MGSRPGAPGVAEGHSTSRPAPGQTAPLESQAHHLRPPPDTFASSAGLREQVAALEADLALAHEALDAFTSALPSSEWCRLWHDEVGLCEMPQGHKGRHGRLTGLGVWVTFSKPTPRAALRLGGGR